MPADQTVSLQINLSPNDYKHSRYLLSCQVDAFIDQVDEVVLVLDSHKSKGRFGNNWDENIPAMDLLIETVLLRGQKVRKEVVDYSPSTMAKVANFFFGCDYIPRKDYRGGPFYAYFYGLHSCQSAYVLHLDSDMFIGGGSNQWVKEALQLFEKNKNLLACSPLPGPPHPDGILIGQLATAIEGNSYQFLFKTMSTRIFMVRKEDFQRRHLLLGQLSPLKRLKALIKGQPPYELPEKIITRHMTNNALDRIDFLGSLPGMWSLHPPYRSESFYDAIPGILKDIRQNCLSASQNGNYDIVDEVVDWSEARERLKKSVWWRRLLPVSLNK